MIIGVGVLLLLPLSVSGATVSISPDKISPGEQVTIAFTGLPDEATLTLLISGKFQTNADGSFMFENSNFNMPFALQDATITANLQNTKTNLLIVKRGDTEVRFGGNSVNNQYSKSFSSNVTPGIYDYFRLSGTAGSPGSTILTDLILSGKKFGPDDGEITFNVGGAENGEVQITVRINSADVLTKRITIAPEETPVATTTVPTTTTGGSSGTGGNGGVSVETTGTVVTTTVTATITNTTTTVATTALPTTTQINATMTGITAANTTVAGNLTTVPPTTTRAGLEMILVPFGIIGALLLMRKK